MKRRRKRGGKKGELERKKEKEKKNRRGECINDEKRKRKCVEIVRLVEISKTVEVVMIVGSEW